MKRCKHETLAKLMASEDGLLYGFSVADGWYYVGTREQLNAVWCEVLS